MFYQSILSILLYLYIYSCVNDTHNGLETSVLNTNKSKLDDVDPVELESKRDEIRTKTKEH